MAGPVALIRARPLALAAAAFVVVEIVIRLLVGGPYPGATYLLLVACGISVLPYLPGEIVRVSIRVALVPALGIVTFAVLLTTLSSLGIALDEVSIRLTVAIFVLALALIQGVGTRSAPADRDDVLALAALACVFAFALAAAWDIVGPFPPPGVDWGHYLLYADMVEVERQLLVEDRFAGEDGRLFADSPGVGAVYGGVLILDGIGSTWLSYGVILLSALSPLSVFAAGAVLWDLRAGVVAAGLYAVSPIHMDPIRWHGVGTIFALVFVPLVVLAIGLMFRGARGWPASVFLGTALLGVAVTHSTSTFVVAFSVGIALLVDLARQIVRHRSGALRAWWADGIAQPLARGVVFACVAGAGVIAHLRTQASDLGSPVSYRLFEPDWLSWRVIEDYYSLVFLAIAAVGLAVVLTSRSLRHDPAFLALVSLGTACAVVAELWRLEIPFEYRRVVHYLAIALVLLVGAASVRLGRGPWTVLGLVLVAAYMAHLSVGLRLPERVLTERTAKGTSAQELVELRERIERREVPDANLLVADECVNFVVPYLLRRPTIVAFEPWQVGFESRVPLAERATAVLEGGSAGRRLAASLGIGYVVANPACTPDLLEKLGGTPVVQTGEIVVIDLRRTART